MTPSLGAVVTDAQLVPLAAVPLLAVPLLAVPLLAVPLLAVPLLAVPLAAVPVDAPAELPVAAPEDVPLAVPVEAPPLPAPADDVPLVAPAEVLPLPAPVDDVPLATPVDTLPLVGPAPPVPVVADTAPLPCPVDEPTDVLPDEGSAALPLPVWTDAGSVVCEHAAAAKIAARPPTTRTPARVTKRPRSLRSSSAWRPGAEMPEGRDDDAILDSNEEAHARHAVAGRAGRGEKLRSRVAIDGP